MLTLAQFRGLRLPVRALVYLFWIYTFVSTVVGVFMQIYVYQLFGSVELNIIAMMLSFTGLMAGFCGYGVWAARRGSNARHGFFASFACITIGVVSLALAKDVFTACLAMTVCGFGEGLFWLTIHTYELFATHDDERDTYSTYLSVGERVISLLAPVFATALIWAAHLLGWGEFSLLFVVTPIILLLGLSSFGVLPDYYPQPIRWHDVEHFVLDARNRRAQLYLSGGGAMHILKLIALPLVSITLLGSALSVGRFNIVFALVGALALLAVGAYRHQGNRLKIFAVTAGALALLCITLGYVFSLAALVIYMLGLSILEPLMRVSEHVIDLQTMGSVGHEKSDFYPTMIFRDISLWVWRMVAGFVLLIGAHLVGTDAAAISLCLYLTAGALVLEYIGAHWLLAARPVAGTGTISG